MRFDDEAEKTPDGTRIDRRGAWRRRFLSAALILMTVLLTAFLDGKRPPGRASTDCGCAKRGAAATACCVPAVGGMGKRP